MFDGALTSHMSDTHDQGMAFGSTRGTPFYRLTRMGNDRICNFPIALITSSIDLSREPINMS
jgi:hypothetical protein